ncbi:hypothetical protein V5O48_010947 [Marasmius crinis-equi]|uniref:Uncharacterized protein n=1 Tax=Marasmius crinis-equi TaxID=585013 RepID=A0ABR3F6Y7_9AGAR
MDPNAPLPPDVQQQFLQFLQQQGFVMSNTQPSATPTAPAPSQAADPPHTFTQPTMPQAQPIPPTFLAQLASSASSSSATPSSSTAGPSTSAMPAASTSTQAPNAPLTTPGPITPYSSISMLNSVAGNEPALFPGREHITTAAGFPSQSLVQRAHAARLSHAADSLPQMKKPKPCGKGKKPPSLFSKTPALSFEDCIADEGGNMTINIAVNVYPPRAPENVIMALGLPHYHVHYVRHQDSFNAVLNTLGLYHEVINVPLATPVLAVLDAVLQAVKDHGYAFQDTPTAVSNIAAHERHPLQLLSFTNLGRPNGRNKALRLTTGAFHASMTIAELLTKPEFAIPKLSITPRRYLELNTDDTDMDGSLGVEEEVLEEECGEEDQDESDVRDLKPLRFLFLTNLKEEQVVEQTLTNPNVLRISGQPATMPRTMQTRSSSSSSSTSTPAAAVSSTSQAVSTPASASESESATFPGSSSNAGAIDITSPLWTTSWEDQSEPGITTIFNFERTTRILEVVTKAFTNNNEGRPPLPLSICGRTIVELADKLRKIILRCLFNKDFGQLLSLDREFRLVDKNGMSVSSGNGVETEVFHTLFHSYFVQRVGEFFAPLTDTHSTLAAVNGASARWMSPEQKQDWGVLGALCAMSLIYGRGTDPLNPLLLIYLINDCNLSSLHSDLVLRLDPQLHHKLKTWKETSHLDDISSFASHFSSFHDIQVSTLRTRTPIQHAALGWEMLHNAVIGPRSVDHPAFALFLKGFRLPCAHGYSLAQVARAFQGGPENFVSTVYASYIAHYSHLPLSYISRLRPETETALANVLSENTSLEAANFEDLFKDFLQGIGYPSLDLMEGVKGRFNSMVNLDGIFDETFRLRMFCWATTGAPSVNTDGVSIKISAFDWINLTPTNDNTNGSAEQTQDANPFGASTPLTVREAVHHWLLASILDNIGQNNVS